MPLRSIKRKRFKTVQTKLLHRASKIDRSAEQSLLQQKEIEQLNEEVKIFRSTVITYNLWGPINNKRWPVLNSKPKRSNARAKA